MIFLSELAALVRSVRLAVVLEFSLLSSVSQDALRHKPTKENRRWIATVLDNSNQNERRGWSRVSGARR